MTTGIQVWESEDLIALLAWLDFCAKHQFNFSETVEGHIKNVRKASKRHKLPPVTKKQAKQKIMDTVRRHRHPGATSRPSCSFIYETGSTCIAGLPEELRKDIQMKMNEYEGSQSLIVGDSANPPSIVKDKNDQSNNNSGGAEKESNNGMESSTQEESPILLRSRHEQDKEHTRPMIGNSRKRVICKPVASSTMGQSTDGLDINAMSKNYKKHLEAKEDEIMRLRAQWQGEVYDLSQQHTKSAQTVLELRAQLKHREIAERLCQGVGKNPLEDTLFEYIHQNWRLLQRVQEMKKQISFYQRTPAQSQTTIQQCIDEAVSTISSELESVLDGHNMSASLRCPAINLGSDLACLIRATFGSSDFPGDEILHFRRCVGKYGSEQGMIIRALISAALREWVFLSDFPHFAPRSCRLLDAYRKVVIIHDGWESAHNLELAAYHSLIDEPCFKNTLIPSKAADLAARLSSALSPLFRIGENEIKHVEIDSWGQRTDICESRKFRLVGLFSAALELKTTTVVAENQFEYVVYPPGTLQTNQSAMNQRHTLPDRQAWLHGSFYMYHRNPPNPQDNLMDARIHSSNFVTKTAEHRTKASLYEAAICVLKAGLQTSSSSSKSGPTESDFVPSGDKAGSDLHGDFHSMSSKAQLDNTGCGPRNEVMLINSETDEETGDDTDEEDLSESSTQTFRCDICRAVFSSKKAVDNHKRTGVCGRCSSCGKICQNKRDFAQHQKEQHPNDSNAVLVTNNAQLYNNRTEGTRYECDAVLQDERYTTPQTAAIQTEAECSEESQESTINRTEPNAYVKPFEGILAVPGVACEKCGKIYKYPGRLERHIAEKMCGQCIDCKLWLPTQDLLLAHQISEHHKEIDASSTTTNSHTTDSLDNEHQSLELGRGGRNVASLVQDIDSRKRATSPNEEVFESSHDCEGDKTYECTICTDRFPEPWSRDDHYKIHGPCELQGHRAGKDDAIDGPREAMCRRCGTSFIPQPLQKRRKLSQNMRVHDVPNSSKTTADIEDSGYAP